MILLRELDVAHKKLWDQVSKSNPEYEDCQDCDPALLSGWTDRDISLWDVTAEDEKPGLQKILVALCRKKTKNWEKISFIQFPAETVSLSGLSLTASNGKTGDQKIDLSGTHYEIKDITGKKLCTLLFHITNNDFKMGLFKEKEYDGILLDAYDNTITRPVVESATTLTPSIRLPSSGTGIPSNSTEHLPEYKFDETPSDESISRPHSSTKQK